MMFPRPYRVASNYIKLRYNKILICQIAFSLGRSSSFILEHQMESQCSENHSLILFCFGSWCRDGGVGVSSLQGVGCHRQMCAVTTPIWGRILSFRIFHSCFLSASFLFVCLFLPSATLRLHSKIRSHSHNPSGAHQCQIHPSKRANEVLKTSENAEMKCIDYSFDPLFVVLRELWATKVTEWWKLTWSARKS